MCGIAGYIFPTGLLDAAILDNMLAKIRHRGPDGDGTWTSPADGLALAHTRLKVQDLTPAADQPMHSPDGRFTLIYNGEIYNFPELRGELRAAGAAFRSTGDTEVLLELCRRQPDLAFLPRLNGMFAFALWDMATKTLSLARDRTGVKPLLYSESRGGLAFASEVAALRPVLADESIDPAAVMQLLTLGFIAAPRTIFNQIHKLRPGHLLHFRNGKIEVKKWAPDVGLPFGTSSPSPFEGEGRGEGPNTSDFATACRQIRETFSDAVRARLLADVPVGVFLSGGIDSAIVTAMACKTAGTRVRTFSVGFPGQPFYDESAYARAVADMHGTDHTVLPLSLDEIRDIIPTVQAHMGEPFADSSALPTYLLSRLTREHVTVALSGDGADELFAGYNRYAATTLIERFGWFARTPLYAPTRALLERLPSRRERKIGAIVSQLKRAIRSMDSRLPHRYANWMRTSDDRTLARLMHDPAHAPAIIEDIVQLLWSYRPTPSPSQGEGRGEGSMTSFSEEGRVACDSPWRGESPTTNDLNSHLAVEWQLSLPDDMLTKIDLMSMAHGLEVRSPFLDYRVVDQVFPMPWQWKLSGWKKKHLLVEAFKADLPPMLHNRPKKGFEVPVGVWLRGPLYQMARDLIANDRCFFGRLLSREGAQQTLDDHAAGRADHNFCLWALVSLLAWQQHHAPTACLSTT